MLKHTSINGTSISGISISGISISGTSILVLVMSVITCHIKSVGVGWSVIAIAFWVDIYYNKIISWALYYLVASFLPTLPWSTCGDWASESCYSITDNQMVHPQCMYNARRAVCDSFSDHIALDTEICSLSHSNCTVTDFTYPTINLSEAFMSINRSLLRSFDYSQPSDGTGTGNNTITLSLDLMPSYCSWQPNITSPATEYFR